jgi:abortive infection bacteriophage resistance protein
LRKDIYNPSVFSYDVFIEDCRKEFARSREIFIRSYKDKYSTPELPAAWMLTEILSMGKWSKISGGLSSPEDQKTISRRFNATPWHLQSWVHSLSYLRNLCAHHSRIWNRTFQIRASLTRRQKESVLDPARLAGFCTVMADLLTTLGRKESFRDRLVDLLRKNPQIPISKMGFAQQWVTGETWR